MSREHDVVALSGAEYDALLSEAEEAARLREQIKRLQKAVERGREFAGTLPAREAVKVRPADWEAIYQAARALTTGGDDARD